METSSLYNEGFTVKTELARLRRIAHRAQNYPREVYTSLYHHMYADETLKCSFLELKENVALGVDGVSVPDYKANLEDNIESLQERLIKQSYKPQPSRRTYIPKVGSRKKRPLGVPCVEDKLVQKSCKEVLEPIYEAKFCDYSYGYRPKRHCHDAIDALGRTIQQKKVSYVVEADIKGFFDQVNHDILIELLSYRIKDKRVIRLIRKMLKAGIMEDGLTRASDEGSPQGSILSPLLSNIYLHYCLDMWFKLMFKPACYGEAYFFRYADDFVACFQYKLDAEKYLKQMKARLERFNLEIEPSKTKLFEFGRFAEQNAKRKGIKPATFDFLGFTHYCSKTRYGSFKLARRTSKKKFTSKLKGYNLWLKEKRSQLGKRRIFMTSVNKLRGHLNYFAINDNLDRCMAFEYQMKRLLFKWVNRMSQRRSYTWKTFPKALEWYGWPSVRRKVNLSPFRKNTR
jgi:group II intron reverse transcriptase/maturase